LADLETEVLDGGEALVPLGEGFDFDHRKKISGVGRSEDSWVGKTFKKMGVTSVRDGF
jgi:hypothetical protein